MMASRRNIRISFAILASLGVHFAAAMAMAPARPKVEIEGGATAEIAALGSSFEDLLAGSSVARPAEISPAQTAKPVVAPETSKPVEMARADVTPAPSPRPAETLTRPAEVVPAKPSQAPLSMAAATAAHAPLAAPQSISAPQAAAVTPEVAPTQQQLEAAAAAKPVQTAALTPAHAAETIEAEPEERPIPVPIARPPQPQDERYRAKAREKQTADRKNPVRKPQAANTARGNADRNARAGHASGRETAKAKIGGGNSGGKALKAGNASASNYPGKVYAKIRRTRQKRAGGRGVAQIRFSISSSGGLASIRIASSSGSGSVDSTALDHIRRSAPFPPPPAGAQRQFVIPIEVRR
jgi:protein TonB